MRGEDRCGTSLARMAFFVHLSHCFSRVLLPSPRFGRNDHRGPPVMSIVVATPKPTCHERRVSRMIIRYTRRYIVISGYLHGAQNSSLREPATKYRRKLDIICFFLFLSFALNINNFLKCLLSFPFLLLSVLALRR